MNWPVRLSSYELENAPWTECRATVVKGMHILRQIGMLFHTTSSSVANIYMFPIGCDWLDMADGFLFALSLCEPANDE